ncbi:major facilitator superfamily domain-containing protein [Rhypophila decipiens]|uniref:Major facilitator superfamily domain-containing protein n=1 Tax=Rhypophila decipiens TaxID=261697 RepID=A0AAN7B7H9_9PEZI|nr:major facilitator superfamily domain-containing protein [Rhypophila decipiens]
MSDQETPHIEKGRPDSEEYSHDPSTSTKHLDAAWQFLDSHRDKNTVVPTDDVYLAKLRRKIDWHIVPLMFLCYTMQFLDKVIINYAAVMGIGKDLNLGPNDISHLATALFAALLFFEVPNVYALQKFPAAKWLGANVILWGVATACGAAATSFSTLLPSRIFLGIFEATIGPSLLLISSQWYTKSEQGPRFSFWYLGLGLGQIVGGLVSYGFQHMGPSSSLSGWRTMFLVLGVVTVVIGVATFLFLPDTPMKAAWLSDEEKIALLRHVSVNQTGISNRNKFRFEEIVEAFLDPQIYLLTLSVILLSVSSGIVTTYSATVIRNLGYDSKQAALMNTPSGAISIIFALIVGFGIRTKSHRWVWIIVCLLGGVTGGALLSFIPKTNKAGALAGVYLVNSVTATLPVFYQWTASNTGGATKRAFAAALISGSFSIGNIIGPQTFQDRDKPEYHPAKIAVLATQAACIGTTFALFMYYVWQNKSRSRAGLAETTEDEFLDRNTWLDQTDRENKRFKYVY